MTLPHPALGEAWRAARPPQAGHHLDSAACSRQSTRVLEAVADHARHEAEIGGYVAEGAAEPLLRQGRAALAGLVGGAAEDLAFVESAMGAVSTLFSAWGLPRGSRVACTSGEYGPNLAVLAAAGLEAVPLPTDDRGRADLDGLAAQLRHDPPTAVHVTHLGSHGGPLQPAREIARLCREAGVPLLLDAAQTLGHTAVDAGADATYSTSRKWLAGPRGVGILVVRPGLAARLRTPLDAYPGVAELPPARRLESKEAHVAGRVGLCLAVGEHLAAGPERVHQRLAALGRATRQSLDGCAGWRVLEAEDEPTAIVTLAPPEGVCVDATRERLRSGHILVTAAGPERAPRAMTAPVLRVSPHLDATLDDVAALAAALPPR